MKFQIPFTFSKTDILKKRSKSYSSFFTHQKDSKLQKYLASADSGLTREEYLGICIRSVSKFFLWAYILFFILFMAYRTNLFFLVPFAIAIPVSLFVFTVQIIYPKIYNNRRERDIEQNLISALQDMLVQLNSGIPLFTILTNLSMANYGELSSEFKKAVKKINGGMPEIEVLEELGESNSSLFFRRTLWQLSNGMRAGSDISIVIRESVKSLGEEQLIQIQNYGNKLNPLIMFYMMSAVIMPALAITFLTIIASLVGLPQSLTIMLFIALFGGVVLVQVVFIGVIRSLRPTLF